MEPYARFDNDRLTIVNDDFASSFTIPDKIADLIITAPPYDEESMTYKEYLGFTQGWVLQAFYAGKPQCRMCIVVPFDKSYRDKRVNVASDVARIATSIGWTYRMTILWNEEIQKSRWSFGSFMSPSAPNVATPVRAIIILHKGKWSRKKDTKHLKSDISRQDFIDWTDGIWTFENDNRLILGKVSTYPYDLAKRCIQLFSFVGDTILDPFAGHTKTLRACDKLNRRFIGMEKDKALCEKMTSWFRTTHGL